MTYNSVKLPEEWVLALEGQMFASVLGDKLESILTNFFCI